MPSLTWHHTPLAAWPVIFLLGSFGLSYFFIVEGETQALIGIPLLALVCWIGEVTLRAHARKTRDRVLLPALASALSDWTARGAGSDGPS